MIIHSWEYWRLWWLDKIIEWKNSPEFIERLDAAYDKEFNNMPRKELPPRRSSVTRKIEFNGQRLIVTFGYDRENCVREVFAAGKKNEMLDLTTDACILLSRLLQCGESISEVASTLSENRKMGEATGPAASIIGAIARAAKEFEDELRAVSQYKDQ